MVNDLFKFKKANLNKLEVYGFVKKDDKFEYKTTILDGQFTLFVFIGGSDEISTKLIDNASEEEYVLHLTGGVGEFVGSIRTEIENILTEISERCFEMNVHKSEQAKEIMDYVREKYGDELEYLWEKFPTDAIWRRKDNKKWYGLIMTISKRKLGVSSDEVVEIMDVRSSPEIIEAMVDNKNYFKGYHMNKKHWITFCLDGSIDSSQIFSMIDASYKLAK